MSDARITRIAGSLVEATPLFASLYELALVGSRNLLGEVIRQSGALATLQVYEDTNGLALGEPVSTTGSTLAVDLGPGLLGSVLDGVGRPLFRVAAATGDFVQPGVRASALDPEARWRFEPTMTVGTGVVPGDVLGTVEEKPGMQHRILVPPGTVGVIRRLSAGDFSISETIGELEDGTPLHLAQRWAVRVPRPIDRRLPSTRPFVTGQRVFDLLFPVAEGGACVVPGGFGTGKTIVQQSLAKFADADVVVYVGCGERGNEMTDVLTEFPTLIDPRTSRPVMDRAVLIVNTSNMPVAAREASIYLGVTVAEYYRDMGYRVALMVDSTSRWAEALRELAARLQEMPGEEGFPTYLASRLGQFLERAGRVRTLGTPARDGAVTIIGAISPPGGDFSEPVTQASLRVAGAMWALDASLAHQRHFPAVDWETSFSLYTASVSAWFAERAGEDWATLRAELVAMLQRERELRDIADLVGADALEDKDRMAMDVAALVRETILRQNAYHPHDAFSSIAKTHALAFGAVSLYRAALKRLGSGSLWAGIDLAPIRRALALVRDAPDAEVQTCAAACRTAIEHLSTAAAGWTAR